MLSASEPIALCEVGLVPEAFCTELARIDTVGPCVRLTFAVLKRNGPDGELHREVVLYLVMPAEALADICVKAALARDPTKLVDAGQAAPPLGRRVN